MDRGRENVGDVRDIPPTDDRKRTGRRDKLDRALRSVRSELS
ncbi:hypothetical protein Ae168Ps1_5852c [Pseudonocardia sp. Ae168_Ps1]|nr:hypothetical protein Ae168Ps1_5852c [Pseudonocardia sp. Ae168_Ps1]OLL77100.1 hypothetical protein Ae150APs1_5478 [Pseudonocardia sp. Ae150A_Ps1]OLL88792.1 hypothetical protein Ae263Ps1_5847c [Pseudonocardia sp. Ae263_Ps1]OLL91188.1 hypothetical protein Ae356Ps1_1085 [Pseudonocardia sp. Ae356_Ps1]